MSRVGKNPIVVPTGVNVNITSESMEVVGKLGKLSMPLSDAVKIDMADGLIHVKPVNNSTRARSLWGTTQRRIKNLVNDIANGVTRNLELVGVGYRASVQGNTLTLQLGFSKDVIYSLPEGITVKCEKPTSIAVSGADRQLVGQVVAEIRKHRPPEPYKGKGVIPQGEFVIRKEGKKK